MELLTSQQSHLLKRIQNERVFYNDLSDRDKVICSFLLELNYITAQRIPRSQSFGGVFQTWKELGELSITEEGKMYLINAELTESQVLFLQEQISSLKQIADTAVNDSEQAKKDSSFSKMISIIAILISIAAIIVPLLYSR